MITKKNVNFTVKNNLCLGCGICHDLCPTNSISINIDNGQYLARVDENICINNKGCHKCTTICPGLGIDLISVSNQLFNNPPKSKHNDLVGVYSAAFTGHAIDYKTRFHGASGGCLTAFLAFLLDNGYITAAVVAENDLTQHFLNKTVLIKSSKDLYKARSSKYCPVSFEGIIKKVKDENGKVAIVGLPCVIQGFRKLESVDPKFKKKIFGYMGLYCSCGRTFNLTEYVIKENYLDIKHLKYFQYRDNGCLGDLCAMDESKKVKIPFQLYYHPLRSFFIPNRCHLCVDHYAELADISFGDIHWGKYKEDKVGINSIVVRNKNFIDIILKAEKSKYITLNSLSEKELVASQRAAIQKKTLVGGYIRFLRTFGKVVPEYDVTYLPFNYVKSIFAHLFIKVQMFIGRRRSMWWIISIFKKKGKIS